MVIKNTLLILAIGLIVLPASAAPKKKNGGDATSKWTAVNAAAMKLMQPKRTKATFKTLDKDKSGELDRAEFKGIGKLMGGRPAGQAVPKKPGKRNKKKAGDRNAANQKVKDQPAANFAAKPDANKKNAKAADAKKANKNAPKNASKKGPKGGMNRPLGGTPITLAKWIEKGGLERAFDKIDADANNTLSEEEFVTRKPAARKPATRKPAKGKAK